MEDFDIVQNLIRTACWRVARLLVTRYSTFSAASAHERTLISDVTCLACVRTAISRCVTRDTLTGAKDEAKVIG